MKKSPGKPIKNISSVVFLLLLVVEVFAKVPVSKDSFRVPWVRSLGMGPVG